MNNNIKLEENIFYDYAFYKAKNTLWMFNKMIESSELQFYSIKFKNSSAIYVWLNKVFIDSNYYYGTLDENDQVHSIKITDAIDWMIIINDRLIGGYTIRHYRSTLSENDRINFDIEFGLKIDDGNDFFFPDYSTPEGVIIKLEEAYNAKSIESVLACKDFFMEAENVLKYTDHEINDYLLSETADLLKTSLIEHINYYGFPEFLDVERCFALLDVRELGKQKLISEKLIFTDGTSKTNKFWIGLNKNDEWKVLDLVE